MLTVVNFEVKHGKFGRFLAQAVSNEERMLFINLNGTSEKLYFFIRIQIVNPSMRNYLNSNEKIT